MFDLNFTVASELQLDIFYTIVLKHWQRLQTNDAIKSFHVNHRMK